MAEQCGHGRKICADCVIITDASRRAADIVNSYAIFVPYDQRVRSWIAIRLADGGHDGTLYESKRDAIRHQPDEFLCAYFSYRDSPGGTNPRDMQLWLDIHRAAYDAGMRFIDPDDMNGGPDMILPTTLEQLMMQRADLIRAAR